MIAAAALFVAAILVFSRAYNLVIEYFTSPTLSGLVTLLTLALALFAVLAALGFIMYATERRLGNVKVKNALFERLLGHSPEAQLGNAPEAPLGRGQTRPEESRK